MLAVPPATVAYVAITGDVPAVVGQHSQVPMGDITKQLLTFDAPVWRQGGWSGNAIVEPAGFTTWEAHTPEVLILYAGGPAARPLATMPLAAVHAALPPASCSGHPARELTTAHWGREAPTGGAWNAPAPGQVRAIWTILRQPHGRLHVAGEHTATRFVGLTEGALESAERVVAELTDEPPAWAWWPGPPHCSHCTSTSATKLPHRPSSHRAGQASQGPNATTWTRQGT